VASSHNLRRAVALAVDRKQIANQVYQGLLDPSAVPASPKAWWYNKAADDSLQLNLEKAREYLKKSKYPNGASFELTLPSEPYLLDVKDAAIVLQSQLAKIGVKVNLRAQEFTAARQAVFDGSRDAGLFVTMSPGEPTYLVQIVLTDVYSMSKATNYNDPELHKLLEQANAEPEDAKAVPIYHRMQEKLAEDCPNIWLGFVHAANLWRARVSGFKVNQGLTMRVDGVSVS
jgi:peptide/nickel transport system substrate-binding protein